MGSKLLEALKAFNLFKLLENETMGMFCIGEQGKSKHEFGGKSAKLTSKKIFYKS